MGAETEIAWTDATWNPWIGCQKISPGCQSCYAAVDTAARAHRKRGLELWGPPSTTPRHRTTSTWGLPMRLHKRALAAGARTRMFVASLCDIFEAHPMVAPWRSEALALLGTCTGLDVQLLTKRPENVRAMVPPSWLTAWPSHVWIGTTVEDQKRADQRIPHLLSVPAAVRFLSVEPLLEAVDLRNGPSNRWSVPTSADAAGRGVEWTDPGASHIPVSWVIVGGESGPRARQFDVAWARSIVAQCREAGVPVFMKQMGSRPITHAGDGAGWPDATRAVIESDARGNVRPVVGLSHKGGDPSEWPEDLRVQEFPR